VEIGSTRKDGSNLVGGVITLGVVASRAVRAISCVIEHKRDAWANVRRDSGMDACLSGWFPLADGDFADEHRWAEVVAVAEANE
jgi:hypothetical protein